MRSRKDTFFGGLILDLFTLFVIIGMGSGYIMNIVKLSRCDFESPYNAEIIRAVGLIPPVGAVTGWLDLGK